MSKDIVTLPALVVLLWVLEYYTTGYKGLGLDKYLLSIIISQAGIFMWVTNYVILSTEYYKENR